MSNCTFKAFNIIRKDSKGVTLLRAYATKKELIDELTQGIYESNQTKIRHIHALPPTFRPIVNDCTVDEFLKDA